MAADWIRTKSDEAAIDAGCYFDINAAERVRAFMLRFLRHSKGQWAGKPFALLDWQWRDLVAPTYGWKRKDGTRRFRKVACGVPKKQGKPISIETLIPTPQGTERMADLRVGDSVFDITGKPCRILAASNVMYGKPCFKLTFSDDTSIVAAADHLWVTKSRAKRKTWGVRTTEEIAGSVRTKDGSYNHTLPVAPCVEYLHAELPVDPYLFGYYLGDGHTQNTRIAVCNTDLADFLQRFPDAKLFSNGIGQSTNCVVPQLKENVKAFGFKHYTDKLIPDVYLRSDREQRLALLRGLMDSDGSVGHKDQCVFCTGIAGLKETFLELVRSLGFKVTSNYVNDVSRTDRNCNGHWRILFTARRSDNVFGLTCKNDKLIDAPRSKRTAVKAIVNVESAPSVPVRCIQVDSPCSMFLCGDGFTPTHNSTLLAALGLYALCADGESGAEVYSCAASREQASIIFNESAAMVDASKALANQLSVKRSGKRITWKNNLYHALSADVPTKEGLNISHLLFDELHAQKTRKLWEALKYGGAARRQPLVWWISTAGVDRGSLCYEQWQRARRIQSGEEIDIETLAVIYEADEEDDWTDERVWYKANPSLGETVSVDSFRADCQEAQSNPATENAFRRYRLNQWTAQETRWIQQVRWKQRAGNYTEADMKGLECIGGLDLATTTDINAFVMLFRCSDGKYRTLPHFWIPQDALRRREVQNLARLDEWVRKGFIATTPGDAVDYNFIKRDICNLRDGFKIKRVVADPWNATSLCTDLVNEGFSVEYCRTGFASISPATKEFEKLVLGGLIEHNANPVLDWMIGNVAVEQDASGNIKPSKRHSAEKIDGVVAVLLALAKYISETKKPSKYEKGGLTVV